MNFPLVDVLYFAGTMVLIVIMAVFIVRSTLAKPNKKDDDTTSPNGRT
jgi:hypothetical protein